MTSYTYDEATALTIYKHIKDDYLALFKKFLENMKSRIGSAGDN